MDRTRRPGSTAVVRVREYAAGGQVSHEDRLAVEEPLEIRLDAPGHPSARVTVTMRTPGHDFELATGLLFAEGLVEPGSVRTVAYCTEGLGVDQEYNVVSVTSDAPSPRAARRQYGGLASTSSACGVCGTESIAEVLALTSVRHGDANRQHVPASVLVSLPARLRQAQAVFARTGGLHAAGLFDRQGALLVAREDIGRHNAVDKVIGARLLAGQNPSAAVLSVSGRIGFEIVQKAAAAGVSVLAAIGAPSSLAVRLAEDAGLCVVGFLSDRRFVAYSCPERAGV